MTDASTKTKPHLGIPAATFVEDVEAYMKKEQHLNAEEALKSMDELLSKYKYMDASLHQKKAKLKGQLPELKHSQSLLEALKAKKDASEDMHTKFLLSDDVYAMAKVEPTEKVCLWLGAGVMLEYTLDDAMSLIGNNIEVAKKSLKEINEDLEFLRDQITVTEVNMARLHNWNVKKVQALKAAGN